MGSKKIVHILESTATGTLTMVSILANMMANKGCEVSVIYSKRDETPDKLAAYFEDSVALIRVDMRPFHRVPQHLWHIREVLNEIQPDILHLHSSIGGFLGRFATIGMSNVDVYYSPHCISFMMANLTPSRRFAYTVLEKFANICGGEYVACSESERAAITKAIPSAVVHKIDNAIDLNIDAPKASPLDGEHITIINVGEVRPQKGPELFADIARKLRQRHPHVHFKWVGDGLSERKKVLTDAGVEISGWMDKNQVMHALSDADLYLSTSFWEGLPVSLIEAMALGLPLIGQACSGNTDVIEDKHNGRLFRSAEEAIEQINEVLTTPQMAQTYAANGLQTAQERFALAIFQSKFSRLYQLDDPEDPAAPTPQAVQTTL